MLKKESTDMLQADIVRENMEEGDSLREGENLEEGEISRGGEGFVERGISWEEENLLERGISREERGFLERGVSQEGESLLERGIYGREESFREKRVFQEEDFAVKVDDVSKSFTRWQRKEDVSREQNTEGKKGNSGEKEAFGRVALGKEALEEETLGKGVLEKEISGKAALEKESLRKKGIMGKKFFGNIFRQEKRAVYALDHVSFRVRRGEFLAYAGPNGAGKSTTMKLLAGMLQPTEGAISVLGMSPEKERIALMKRLGVLFGNRTELWWDHPVIQSFEWKKVVWDIPDAVYRRNLDMVTELLDIGEIRNTFARELSLGQRMRADLAMMLLHSPELILLDEPTLGLDVVAKRQMIEFLKKINREEGVTILVTSHDMDDLEEMAQRILMISGGKIVYDGSFDGLREITGNLTHFTVTTDGRKPELEGCRFLGGKNGVFEFEVDLSCIPVRGLLERLSQADGIMDVEIRKAPVEKVIAQLYQNWKNA